MTLNYFLSFLSLSCSHKRLSLSKRLPSVLQEEEVKSLKKQLIRKTDYSTERMCFSHKVNLFVKYTLFSSMASNANAIISLRDIGLFPFTVSLDLGFHSFSLSRSHSATIAFSMFLLLCSLCLGVLTIHPLNNTKKKVNQ